MKIEDNAECFVINFDFQYPCVALYVSSNTYSFSKLVCKLDNILDSADGGAERSVAFDFGCRSL